jgi:hypothetical protein
MDEIVREWLASFVDDRSVQLTMVEAYNKELQSGRHSAFLELAYRKMRDDAQFKATVIELKVQLLRELLEEKRKRDGRSSENHR